MPFKKGFVWGAASSAYQIEGAVNEGGRGKTVWDTHCEKLGAIKNGESGAVACDHYRRMESDLDLFASLDINAYRFSLAWTRLLPEGTGKVNNEGLDFYDRMIDGLLERGIDPYVTLFHWDYPQALFERGGWLNRDSADWFADYAAVVAKRYSDRVKNFLTLNEPQCFVQGHANGEHAPGQRYADAELCKVAHHCMLAHGKAVAALRANAGQRLSLGIALCGNPKFPDTDSPPDQEAALACTESMIAGFGSDVLYMEPIYRGQIPPVLLDKYPMYSQNIQKDDLKIISAPLDVFAVNMYTAYYIKASGIGKFEWLPRRSGVPVNSLGWATVPEVVYAGAKYYQEKYKLPILVTENGYCGLDCPDSNGEIHDNDRINFISRYLAQLKKAADEGVDVTGYFYWSIMDNFEWSHGYDPRFGLIHVDYASQKRTVKQSGKWYAQMIRSHAKNFTE